MSLLTKKTKTALIPDEKSRGLGIQRMCREQKMTYFSACGISR